MKQRIAVALSGMLFFVLLWSSGIMVSIGNRIEPTMQQVTQTGVEVPVIMYHQLLKDEKRVGDYVITPEMFEGDMLELQVRGYQPVTVAALQDYIADRGTLPSKPILITFDDGYETFYEYGYSVLQKYDYPAVVSIIGKYTDLYSSNIEHDLSYGHLSWEQLSEMVASGLVEVGNHSYSLHQNEGGRKGILQLPKETAQEYQTLLQEDVGALKTILKQELDVSGQIFSYPYGAYTETTQTLLQAMGFTVFLGCEEKVNFIQPGDTILQLNRFNRSGNYESSAAFFDHIEE